MYTLHYAPGAASLAPHWMLIELGVPFEEKRLDLEAGDQKKPEYLAINPAGLVPTLMVDGAPMTEAAALLLWLAEQHPEARLAPAPGTAARRDYYQWMLHLANTLQPAFRAWFYPHEPAGEAHVEAVQQAARSRVEACWERIDAHLGAKGPYMAGAPVTAVDFLAAMLMRWSRNMPKPATEWPQVRAYVARMKARPSFRELYAREGLTEWA